MTVTPTPVTLITLISLYGLQQILFCKSIALFISIKLEYKTIDILLILIVLFGLMDFSSESELVFTNGHFAFCWSLDMITIVQQCHSTYKINELVQLHTAYK